MAKAKDDDTLEQEQRAAEEADEQRLHDVAAAGDVDEEDLRSTGTHRTPSLAEALAGAHGGAGGHAVHATDGAHGADDHDHGLAHTTPLSLLFGVLGALLVLTIITVAVTAVDLGANGNLWVAMIIATIKAALVCVFFMHLAWDQRF